MTFSPDGKTLATESWDKTVKLWNLENRRVGLHVCLPKARVSTEAVGALKIALPALNVHFQ